MPLIQFVVLSIYLSKIRTVGQTNNKKLLNCYFDMFTWLSGNKIYFVTCQIRYVIAEGKCFRIKVLRNFFRHDKIIVDPLWDLLQVFFRV